MVNPALECWTSYEFCRRAVRKIAWRKSVWLCVSGRAGWTSKIFHNDGCEGSVLHLFAKNGRVIRGGCDFLKRESSSNCDVNLVQWGVWTNILPLLVSVVRLQETRKPKNTGSRQKHFLQIWMENAWAMMLPVPVKPFGSDCQQQYSFWFGTWNCMRLKSVCVELSTCWVHGIFVPLCEGSVWGFRVRNIFDLLKICNCKSSSVRGSSFMIKFHGPQIVSQKGANSCWGDAYGRLDMWICSMCVRVQCLVKYVKLRRWTGDV